MPSPLSKTLLVIDDDKLFCDSVASFFNTKEFSVITAHTGKQGLDWCRQNRADVVLLDQKLPDTEGLKLCAPILTACEQAKIIFITAFPSFDHAVRALRSGAHDYLSKPMELQELSLAVELAFRTVELERVEQLQKFHNRRESKKNTLIGIDGGLREIRHLMELAASNRAPVLITGETGTGKNVVAKAIHYLHDDQTSAFVGTNCAALPENLIESELFGHEKGAFTGALSMKKGIFEMADGGTLFLDEIGELPLHLQSKLLGVLDDGILRRLGGQTVRKIDARIIASTNVEMDQAIAQRTFRKDLYYRLSVLRIHLPPLRERKEDIEKLSYHFIKSIAPDQKLALPHEELKKLGDYPWPGNVRELKNIIERAIILQSSHVIYPGRLLQKIPNGHKSKTDSTKMEHGRHSTQPLAEVEKNHIKQSLVAFNNNHTHTAQALGIARSTLIRKLEVYGIRTSVSFSDTVAE